MPERVNIFNLNPDPNSGFVGCWLGLEGDLADDKAGFTAKRVVLNLSPDGTGDKVADAELKPSFDISGNLLSPPADYRYFKRVTAATREFYREVARRLAVQAWANDILRCNRSACWGCRAAC